MLYRLLLIILLVTVKSPETYSRDNLFPQVEGWWVQNFTDENGLPQNSVKDLILDSHGFLWMATENGIVRYDGRQFDVFSNRNRPIGSARFRAFHSSSSVKPDVFYAISEKSEVLKITGGRVARDTAFLETILPGTFLPGEEIEWSSGLQNNFWLPPARGSYPLPVPEEKNNYFQTSKNHVRFFKGDELVWQTEQETDFYADFFLLGNQLYHTPQKDSGEVFLWNNKGPSKAWIFGDFFPSSDTRWKIYTNKGMSQAFIYSGERLYMVTQQKPGALKTRLIASGINLEALNTACLYYDERQERLFVGSYTKGLFILKKNSFHTLEERLGTNLDNAFYAQIPLDSHHVLTPQGSILGLDPSSGKKTYRESSVVKARQAKDRYSMARDASGNIWTKNKHLLTSYNATAERQLAEWDLPFEITQIKEDSSGGLWIGTMGHGIYRLEAGAGSPEPYLQLGDVSVSCIAPDGGDTLWIGTNAGLYEVSLKTRDARKIDIFGEVYIRSLYVEKDGRLWITTYEKGFFLYKDGQLTQFPLDQSGYLQSAHCIVEDTAGFFWIPTNKGLYQVHKKDLLAFAARKDLHEIWYKRYLLDEGFKTNEFNGGCQPCGVRLPNGYVSLPSLNGLVWFKPEALRPETPSAPLHIDMVFADDDEIEVRAGNFLTLSSPPNYLKFRLNLPYLGNQSEIQISYALASEAISGQDTIKWTAVPSDDPTIHLFNLNPGNHTLIIKKANGFGIDNYTLTEVRFSVPKLWYQTWWFYMLMLLSTGIGIFAITRLNNNYLKRKNEILENAVAQRTSDLNKILKTLTDSREALIKQSFIQEQIIASISHDLKTPLRFLIRLNKLLYDDLISNGSKEAVEMCKASYETSEGLDALITNLLEYVKINPLKPDEIDKEPVVLFELVENKIALFSGGSTLDKSSARVRNLIPPDFTVVSNYHLLGIIIQNLLDNSLKASSAGIVTITLDENETMVFHNTGYTIPPPILQWINTWGNADLDSEKRIGLPPHNGIGLMIIKQLTMLLNITLSATSEADEGTYFNIRLTKEI